MTAVVTALLLCHKKKTLFPKLFIHLDEIGQGEGGNDFWMPLDLRARLRVRTF